MCAPLAAECAQAYAWVRCCAAETAHGTAPQGTCQAVLSSTAPTAVRRYSIYYSITILIMCIDAACKACGISMPAANHVCAYSSSTRVLTLMNAAPLIAMLRTSSPYQTLSLNQLLSSASPDSSTGRKKANARKSARVASCRFVAGIRDESASLPSSAPLPWSDTALPLCSGKLTPSCEMSNFVLLALLLLLTSVPQLGCTGRTGRPAPPAGGGCTSLTAARA